MSWADDARSRAGRALRRWLILGLLALVVAASLAILWRRQQTYLGLLAYHNDQELVFSLPQPFPVQAAERNEIARRLDKPATDPAVAAEMGRRAANRAKRAAYHAALKAKYQAVVSRPWMSVDPDPSPP